MGCFQFGVLPFFFLPLRFDTTFLSQNVDFFVSAHTRYLFYSSFLSATAEMVWSLALESLITSLWGSVCISSDLRNVCLSWAKATFASSCFSLEAKCFGLSWVSILDFTSPCSTLRVDNILVVGKVCVGSYCSRGRLKICLSEYIWIVRKQQLMRCW